VLRCRIRHNRWWVCAVLKSDYGSSTTRPVGLSTLTGSCGEALPSALSIFAERGNSRLRAARADFLRGPSGIGTGGPKLPPVVPYAVLAIFE